MARPTNDKPARLIDVAQRAKVSRATAARVLGGYGRATDATRERVLAAAHELNYRVNELARSMRSGRTLTIGVIVADIANSFFNSVIRAIIETASGAGYQILVLNTDDDIDAEIKAVQVLVEKRVDGLIVVPACSDSTDHLQSVRDAEIPIVLLDRHVDSMDIDYVITDDVEGARMAVVHLAEAGHRRIGLLVATASATTISSTMPDSMVSTASDRFTGARDTIVSLGLRLESEWIRFCCSNMDDACQAAVEILSARPGPTAILATNEEMALGVVAAAEGLGLAIGADFSIIAFDDTSWAKVFRPPLSVIRRPVAELGSTAVKLLLAKIGNLSPQGSCILAAQLVSRQSVAMPTMNPEAEFNR